MLLNTSKKFREYTEKRKKPMKNSKKQYTVKKSLSEKNHTEIEKAVKQRNRKLISRTPASSTMHGNMAL